MALMNDDDDWDMDDTNVPAPMDSAKARLNQTTAVFAGRQNIHEIDFTLEKKIPHNIVYFRHVLHTPPPFSPFIELE